VKIISFGQVVNLEQGSNFTHQFTVRLDNEEQVDIVTDEDTIAQLVTLIDRSPHIIQGGSTIGTTRRDSKVDNDMGRSGWENAVDNDMGRSGWENTYATHNDGISGVATQAPILGVMDQESITTFTVPSPGIGSGKPVRVPRIDKDGFALPIQSRTVEMNSAGYPVISGQLTTSSVIKSLTNDDGVQI
jgi:hypothetical protein